MSVMIVGGDSRLSRELIPLLADKGEAVHVTSRRMDRVPIAGEKQWFLDLDSIDAFRIPDDVDRMVIVGGVVSYEECSNRFDYAYRVNCVNIPHLAEMLLTRGGYVCFISTNTVFKFERGLPDENASRCPGFPYARLKATAEEKLEEKAALCAGQERFCILRLTKNVGMDTSPFAGWMETLSARRPIRAFNDLYFAPVRFADSARAVETILDRRPDGILHLSGERDISYADFAGGLCRHMGLPASLAMGICAADVGITLIYNHPITALAMNRTRERLGLTPVPLAAIYGFLSQGFT